MRYTALCLVPILFRVNSERLFPSGVENCSGSPVNLFKSFIVHKNGNPFEKKLEPYFGKCHKTSCEFGKASRHVVTELLPEFPSWPVLDSPGKMVVKSTTEQQQDSLLPPGFFIT